MSGFTDEEKERIRQKLIEEGRELFARYGLRKTTIADLTEPADIAKSTFYTFYDSKEELYLEILDEEGEKILPEVMEPFEKNEEPEDAVKEFLISLMNEIETNPLIRRLLTDREGMERIREYFSEEERDQHRRESISYFLPYIEEWHEEGKIKGSNPEVTANAVRSISLLTLHQDDIGESYDEVRNLVIEAFAAGLTED